MLSFAPHYTPPGEYEELLTVHVLRRPKQTISRSGTCGRGRQGKVGIRRGRGRIDHQLVDQDNIVANLEPDVMTSNMPNSSMSVVDAYYPVMDFDMPNSSMSAHKDAAETQVEVAQHRSKRERQATRCGTSGHRY
ncbi:hypothetical protein K7X08_000225 [Anisodus acutangulus]|uniref:Uncharacterized protein n=1 Tax=Anisodus acutangulus TaxID=402998 RepID=A0A9Q1RDY2_9SOLA|nr:hypothetical protein K7X08_000225 [Anisodus acutangulus]